MDLNVDNFREKSPEFLFSKLSKDRNALLDAPPGLGKTRGAAKVAIRLVKESGKRVLIIEPTKTLRTMVAGYIEAEDKDIEFHISKGWRDYKCPLIGASTNSELCSQRRKNCKEENIVCDVLKDLEKIKTSNLTVATFAKLLLSKGSFNEYDTIIVDESHGFENAESSYLQTYVMFRHLEEVSKEVSREYPNLEKKLSNLFNGLSRMNAMLGDSNPLTSREVDIIRKQFDDPALRDSCLSFVRDNKYPRFGNLYSNISSLHFRMQNINKNIFFFYEDSLYGRPRNMEAEISGFFKDKNVGLLSATIDNAVKHARSCGLDMRRFSSEDAIILSDYPEIRRKNRKLIALKDGPMLGRSGGNYNTLRIQANRIIEKLLESFVMRTLVLFRGYNDQKMAWNYLKETKVSSRIENVWQGEDTEIVDEKIQTLRENDVVLSSAATRLWEGVDIPELRLVIIDALPYPGKDPLDRKYNFRTGYTTMIKKLKQGLGRIVRSDDDWGVAVVIDKRFDDRFRGISSRLPWSMGDDFKRLSFDIAIQEITKFINDKSG